MPIWWRSKRTIFIILSACIALILAGLSAWGYLIAQKQHALGPTGTIFLTGTADDSSPFLNTFALDVIAGSLTRLGEDARSLGNFYTFTSDRRIAAFVGTTRDRLDALIIRQITPGAVMQIYRAPVVGHQLPLPSQKYLLTADNSPIKSSPAISDDAEHVAYVAASSSSEQISSLVHVVDTKGNDTTLVTGTQPRWYSNGSFYYIAPDGVRLFDTAASISTLVLPIPGQSNYKLALSHDHSTLVFSVPDAKAVYFYRITDRGFTLAPEKTLAMRGFWVVFSPDDRFAAIQTAEGDTPNTLTQPSLVIVDLASFAVAKTMPINDLLNDRLFISDWVD